MEISLSPREEAVLKKIAGAAWKLDLPCYLIGGYVRDKLLGRPTKDADIVCVGNGLQLAEEAARAFQPLPKVSFFKNYGTAHFRLSDGFDVEFVGARRESYRSHTRNPEVEPGTLSDDQNRRDFTINALAISLNKDDFGTLVDPFGGTADLQKKIIRTPLEPVRTF
ncbi:MAG TPA: tRNA nucleotidyltransferase, partial [Chitinophagaceae bacterium]|nr:tRNA nucleotidyltransferase [Chitinophagaceae bacterium]